MKRIFFLAILALFLKLPLISQTVIWDESFSEPSADWDIEGNWAFDNGSLLFYYYPVVENFDFSAVSPEIQIPAFPSELSLNQFIDPYLSGVTNELCEIYVVTESEDVLIFSYEIINGTWGENGGSTFTQSLDQFEGQSVRFKFRTSGATTNSLWNWTLYDVSIKTDFQNEICALETNGPAKVFPGIGGTWQVSFKNTGLLPQSDFQVRLFSYKTGDQVGEETYSGTVNPGGFGEVNFQWIPQDYQNTSLYGVIVAANDEFPANNRSKGHFVRVEPPIEYNVLVWDNDNGIPTIYNPETGQEEQSSKSIEHGLAKSGIIYDLVQVLPDDLSEYDLILCTMGTYCLS